MRSLWLGLLGLLLFASAAAAQTQAQTDSPEPDPPSSRRQDPTDAIRWIRDAERYKGICRMMSSGQSGQLFPLAAGAPETAVAVRRLFMEAIDRYCAFGDFVFTWRDSGGKCSDRPVLGPAHVAFLSSLALVRQDAKHRVHLECVALPDQLELRFEQLEAASITLRSVKANRVLVMSSKLPGGIRIESSEITRDVYLAQLADTGPIIIDDTKIENRVTPRWQSPLEIRNSTIESLAISRTTVDGGVLLSALSVRGSVGFRQKTEVTGNLQAIALKAGGSFVVFQSEIKGLVNLNDATVDRVSFTTTKVGRDMSFHGLAARENFGFWNKSEVKGKIDARGMQIGGVVIVSDSKIDGNIDFDYLSANRIAAEGATFGGEFAVRYARIASRAYLERSIFKEKIITRGSRFETALIIDKSTFEKYAQFDYVNTERVDVLESKFLNTLDLEYVRAGTVKIDQTTIQRNLNADYTVLGSLNATKSTIGPLDCEGGNCRVQLFNAEVGYLRMNDFTSRRLSAGNARFRVLILSGATTFHELNCGDCLIEQYALIGARFAGWASLAGAEIRGTLAFSEGNDRARWAPDARLDLSELRVDAISANACDLMVEKADGAAMVPCEKQGADDRRFVPTTLNGARYRTIVPSRQRIGPPPAPPATPAVETRPISAVASEAGPAGATALLDLPPERIIELVGSANPTGYNPQPYEEMAEALTRAGKNLEAIEVRVARINERLDKVETNPFIHLWYWVYYFVSHYGFKNWRAFLYFIGLVGVGTLIYHRAVFGNADSAPEDLPEQRGRLLYSIWFSLDRAVPPLRLDPRLEEELKLSWWARQYFYFHRVAGTILISVFAAGLAGLGH